MSKTILNRTQGTLAKSSITQDLRSWKRLILQLYSPFFLLAYQLIKK